jgi:hypothetical protein
LAQLLYFGVQGFAGLRLIAAKRHMGFIATELYAHLHGLAVAL